MEFTKEQSRVISERDSSILVSAAAGSGKTTVLVERIIQKILDKDNPVDIDRILVLTFTNAAAAHMREKVEEAILKAIEKDPENEHLLKQESLIHNSQITTIHSFCLFILKNNFTKVSLDPGFRVADEGEVKLLKGVVLDEVIDALFEENIVEGFEQLADRFAKKNKLTGLKETILSAYEQSESSPFFEDFIAERRQDYYVENGDFESTDWGRFLVELIKNEINDAKKMATDLLTNIQTFGGARCYLDNISSDVSQLEDVCDKTSFEEIMKYLSTFEFTKLGTKKYDGDNAEAKDKAKKIRDKYKETITGLVAKYGQLSKEEMLEGLNENNKIVNILMDVLEIYNERLTAEKNKRKIIDFSDMEHLALRVLLEKKDGEYVPTKEAKDYRDFFNEIMVDEYQDSNIVQELMLSTISGEENGNYNRFMVGDVKQSIYGFRKACPDLFLEKYNTYTSEKSECVRIDLSKNYRSRDEVVDSVNFLCEKLLAKDLGGIEYDDAARLYREADYPQADCDNKTEVLVLENNEEIADNKKSGEAMMVACKINELIKNHQVMDDETKTMRPCTYKDIVILLRSSSGWDEEFKKTLESQGIPAFVESKKGYFSSTEVKMVLSYLKTIDNPRNEIDLFGAMISPFGGFDDEDVAKIKNYHKGNLYDALIYITNEDICDLEDELVKKVFRFVEKLTEYRKRVAYDTISKIVSDIVEDSGYLFNITSMPYGEQRKANVLMLVEMAKNYETGSFRGLYHFVRYIEEMKNYDMDFGEATVLDEKSNVVRIMTMHKSKGLEFPVCFVSGLGKGFNHQDEKGDVVFDRKFGLGLDYVDLTRGVKYKDIRCNVLKTSMKLNMLAEELRVLYVALTRAKEKLILTAAVNDLEKFNADNAFIRERCEEKSVLPWSVRSGAKSFLELIMACINADSKKYIKYKELTVNDIEKMCVEEKVSKAVRKANAYGTCSKEIEHSEVIDEVIERINYQYEHSDLADLFTKTSVSELKIAAIHDGLLHSDFEEVPKEFFTEHENNAYVPNFIGKEDKVKGTTRGSAYHRVMELIDFDKINSDSSKEYIEELIEKEITSGKIDREEASLVDANKVVTFFKSELGLRMCEAKRRGELYLEEPFVLSISADRLDKKYPKEESVLIQGIIDAFFIEDGKIVLMDYKTDAVNNEEALIERYKVQLDYYSEALERIRGMKVAERLIYSFALAKTINID